VTKKTRPKIEVVFVYDETTNKSIADSTKVLCPRFDVIEILIPGDLPSIFPSSDKM